MVLILNLLHKLILVLDNGFDTHATHGPVVLKPFLEIRIFELVILIALVNILKQLFHRTVYLLIWVSLRLGNVSMR